LAQGLTQHRVIALHPSSIDFARAGKSCLTTLCIKGFAPLLQLQLQSEQARTEIEIKYGLVKANKPPEEDVIRIQESLILKNSSKAGC
jgi:hypothetical protein